MVDIITDTPPAEVLTARARAWIAAGALTAAVAAVALSQPSSWRLSAPAATPSVAAARTVPPPAEAPVVLSGPVVTTQVLVRPHPARAASAPAPVRPVPAPHRPARPRPAATAPHREAHARPSATPPARDHARTGRHAAPPAAKTPPRHERPRPPRSWKD